MVNPVPARTSIINPFNAWGRLWSCNRNGSGHGRHTGVDLMAPRGARVIAARPGVARHVYYGKNLGTRQLLIECSDGSADFYAHMSRRASNGARIAAGEWVGYVSDEGNAKGTHLHFERFRTGVRSWSCSAQTDPWPSIRWAPPSGAPIRLADLRLGKRSESARTYNGLLWARQSSAYRAANYAAWMNEPATLYGAAAERITFETYARERARFGAPPGRPCWPGPVFVRWLGGSPV